MAITKRKVLNLRTTKWTLMKERSKAQTDTRISPEPYGEESLLIAGYVIVVHFVGGSFFTQFIAYNHN